ncbi:Uncharacterised protein [Vibrio cholerae]|nr:Uncharacterised protein [Vibrio cholerae]
MYACVNQWRPNSHLIFFDHVLDRISKVSFTDQRRLITMTSSCITLTPSSPRRTVWRCLFIRNPNLGLRFNNATKRSQQLIFEFWIAQRVQHLLKAR